MALEFTLYRLPPTIGDAVIPVPIGAEIMTSEVAVGAGNQVSGAFPADTHLLIATAAEDCRIAIGAAPVAANAGTKTRLLKAGSVTPFFVNQGEKIAAIQAAP